MYYSADAALSYNPILLMTLSARGGGKTYHWKKRVIKRFLKDGATFIWVRRYATEISEMLKDSAFLSDIANDEELKGVKLEIDGKTLKVNDKIAGRFIALSQSQKYKSTPFPSAWVIVFDEFIIARGAYHYIGKNESTILEDLISTVFRRRKILCVCLANAITFSNPYFLHYRVRPFDGRFNYNKEHAVLVEMWNDNDYTESVNDSDFARLTGGTKYGDYAINNKFLLDNQNFIEKRTPKSKFICGIKTTRGDIGFWYDDSAGLIFSSFALDKNATHRMYTVERADHSPNLIFLHNAENTYLAQVLYAWRYGLLRFDDIRVKSIAFDVLEYFRE